MKDFKQHILEKLKVNANKNHDPRDYETVDMLSENALDKRKFREYLQDCLNRDKYNMQSSDFEFHNTKVLYYYGKYVRSLCSYSVNDTYIELYDRIIDTLKEYHFINEKLKLKKGYTNYLFHDLQPLSRIHFDYKDFVKAFEDWAKTFNKEVVVYPLENTFYDTDDLPIIEGTEDDYRPKAFYPNQYVTGLMIGKTHEHGLECFRLQTRINREDVEKFNDINKKDNAYISEISSCPLWKSNKKLELAKILGKGDYKMGYAVMKYIYDEITNENI